MCEHTWSVILPQIHFDREWLWALVTRKMSLGLMTLHMLGQSWRRLKSFSTIRALPLPVTCTKNKIAIRAMPLPVTCTKKDWSQSIAISGHLHKKTRLQSEHHFRSPVHKKQDCNQSIATSGHLHKKTRLQSEHCHFRSPALKTRLQSEHCHFRCTKKHKTAFY